MDKSDVKGLELEKATGIVRAIEAGAGPVGITSASQGFESKPVMLRTVGVPLDRSYT